MSLGTESFANKPARTFVAYGLMIAATVAMFFAIRFYGEGLSPPASGEPLAAPGAAPVVASPLVSLLIALAAVIVLGRVLARLFAYIGQPAVIGEVVAGICLGPSLLGRVWPEVGRFILPATLAPTLSIVAQLGIIIYMFLVGLELNAGILRRQGHITLAISHTSIVIPFLLGALLALWLYPILSTSDVPFTPFALFLSVAMSITAFPVLARILTDRQLHKTELGAMALACAAIDDVSAWCMLALVVGVAQSQLQMAVWVMILAVSYIVAMFWVVRPVLARIFRCMAEGLTPTVMALVLVGVLASALATEAIGIHAIFGAFIFGAVIPHNSPIARELALRLEGFVTVFLLPAYFAFTGMRTQIGLVTGLDQWLICLAIIGVATLGKFGGTLSAARIMGIPWRDAASLGILMNTRGLMELIVLNIGLDLAIISPTLFAMMVLMALATTMITSPILSLLMRGIGGQRADEPTSVAYFR